MSIYIFESHRPTIAPDAYIAPSAIVIGNVSIGPGCYIGHGAILRGDYGTITIGEGSAIEEGVIIHARPADKTTIGVEVTVGHGAMIHNATIHDYAVIGMRATISDYSTVGQWAIIGEGALVKNGQIIPAEKVAVGVPAKVIADVADHQRQLWTMGKSLYQDLAKRYPDGLKEISREEALPEEDS